MSNSQAMPGVVGPFAGMDVPWLLADAGRKPSRSSVSDLGAVRCAGAESGAMANSTIASAHSPQG